MGKCLISITLLSCSLVLSTAGWTKEPALTEQDVANMDTADLVAVGTELVGFFVQKQRKEEAYL